MSTTADAAAALAAKWEAQGTTDGPVELDDALEAAPANPEPEPAPESDVAVTPESGEPEPQASGETIDAVTLDAILEHVGYDPDAVKTVLQVDGEPVEVSMAEALAGYQREADYRRKTQALADERRAFEEQRESQLGQAPNTELLIRQQLHDMQQRQAEQIGGLEQYYDQLVAQAQQQGDDQRVLALRFEKREQLESFNQRAAAEYHQLVSQKQSIDDWLIQQAQEQSHKCDLELRNKVPGLHEPEALDKWKNENVAYAEKATGKPAELLQQALLDPNVWMLVDKARRFDAAQAGLQAAKTTSPTLAGGVRRTGEELRLRSAKQRDKELAEKQRNARNSMDSMAAATERLSNAFAQRERGRRRHGLS